MIQTEHGCVFIQDGKSLFRIINTIFIYGKPMCYFIYKVVAGILKSADYVKRAMAAGFASASDVLSHIAVDAGAIYGLAQTDPAIFA